MTQRSIGKQITYIARALNRYVDQQTAHLNLSSATVPFLTYLYGHNGVHQDEMAANLQFDKSSVTRAVKALQKRGYVDKSVDPGNKRRNLVTVTDLGLSIKDELLEILKQTTRLAFAGFGQREMELYFQYTDKLNQNIKLMVESKS